MSRSGLPVSSLKQLSTGVTLVAMQFEFSPIFSVRSSESPGAWRLMHVTKVDSVSGRQKSRQRIGFCVSLECIERAAAATNARESFAIADHIKNRRMKNAISCVCVCTRQCG